METILFIPTSTIRYEAGFTKAISSAKGARLFILFIVEKKGIKGMTSNLRNLSFIGMKPEGQLTNMVSDEYHMRAIKIMNEIEKHASALGINCSTKISIGDFFEETLRVIQNQRPTKIIISKAEDSFLSRYIFTEKLDTLKQFISCPIEIVNEPLENTPLM